MNFKSKRFRLSAIGLVLVLFILACVATPGGQLETETPEVDTVATAVKQTLIVATVFAEQTRVAALQNPPEGQQAPAAATATFTPESSATQGEKLPPSETPTPEFPVVSVSENTNCRTGPGQVYELIGALLVDEETEIVAKDSTETFWYVRNPDRDGYCWLWAYYATTSGNTAALPVFTPPPTPTFTPSPTLEPKFSANYDHFDQCGAVWHITFRIVNDGGLAFSSVTTTTTDNDTNETVNYTSDIFENYKTCILDSAVNDLAPGESGFTSSGSFSNNPDNHQVIATVRLCSEDGLLGTCIERAFTFTP
ncbi:MAG: hypothetical protein ISR58_22235 [Anaerolineales bacterium]|nr:hypothetical protein [Chloroflexota bacterium]MBL6983914.1 hypothetical protein [Anaerolineales bacterium]